MLRQPRKPKAEADWSISKAYGLGINALYLNLKGPQRDGIVEPGQEAEKLIKELKEPLEEQVDPVTGQPVLRQVYRAADPAPSILAEFGLPAPSSMTGKSIFT
jgi:predicted AlkP superfamily phosphohydrolase/phosphomutase